MKVLGGMYNRYKGYKIKKEKHGYFENWQDAVKYLGKQVSASAVEYPDTKGMLKGIYLVCHGDEIIGALLEIGNLRFDYKKCKPL